MSYYTTPGSPEDQVYNTVETVSEYQPTLDKAAMLGFVAGIAGLTIAPILAVSSWISMNQSFGLIASLLLLLAPLIAIIAGHIGFHHITSTIGYLKGKGFAIAAFCMGYLGLGWAVLGFGYWYSVIF